MHETGYASKLGRPEGSTRSACGIDCIVVGAGSRGCALAGRLADRCPDATIALVEAGPHTDRNLLVNMPVGVAVVVPNGLPTN